MVSSSDCVGKNYEDVIQEFKSEGFFNIEVEERKDLEYKELSKRDTVESVIIDGQKDFKKGESYINSVKIYLIYHSPQSKVVPISAKDAKGMNFRQVKKVFNDAGFYNIKLEQDKDLITGWITKNGEVESISLNEDKEFMENVERAIDSEIKIKYHTFKEKSRIRYEVFEPI